MTTHAASSTSTEPVVSGSSRRLLAWRPVVVPWIVSRVVAAIGLCLVGAKPFGRVDLDALADWDTGWFQSIVRDWYGPAKLPTPWAVGPEHWTRWPFFPLAPALARVVQVFGVSGRVSLIVVNNLAFLLALAGLYRLARRHVGTGGASLAVWAMALFPGSITSVMGYSGGLFVAGMVWAFVFVEDERFLPAGLAIAVAVSARPNGFLLLAPLALAAFLISRRVRPVVLVAAPSVVFLVAWATWCRHVTGDALVFFHAKAAWEEVSLGQFLRHPLAGNSTVHVFLCAIAVLLLLTWARRTPLPWHLLVAVMVLPSLALGMTGLGRYSAESFPVFIAAAGLLGRLPRWTRPLYLVASALGLVLFGAMVNRWRYVP